MNPRVKEATLWGVIGLFTFLVLLQGYELLQDVRIDLSVKIGATAAVAIATTAITYLANRKLTPVEGADGQHPANGAAQPDGDQEATAESVPTNADADVDSDDERRD